MSSAPLLRMASLCLVLLLGCQFPADLGLPMVTDGNSSSRKEKEELKRSAYLLEKDPDALQWFLANRFEAGMPLADINEMLGERGKRVYNDKAYKTNGSGKLRADDETYKWGPANDGTSIILFFRNGKLINFDPEEFQDVG